MNAFLWTKQRFPFKIFLPKENRNGKELLKNFIFFRKSRHSIDLQVILFMFHFQVCVFKICVWVPNIQIDVVTSHKIIKLTIGLLSVR